MILALKDGGAFEFRPCKKPSDPDYVVTIEIDGQRLRAFIDLDEAEQLHEAIGRYIEQHKTGKTS